MQRSLRLFQLRERPKNGRVIPDTYFSNKMDAKAARDSGAYGSDLVVVLGPDHRRYDRDYR